MKAVEQPGAARPVTADSHQAVTAFANIRWRTAPGAPVRAQRNFSALGIAEDAAEVKAVTAFANIRWRSAPGAPVHAQRNFSALGIAEDTAAGVKVVPDLVVDWNSGLSSAAGGKFKGVGEVPSAPCHAVQLEPEAKFAATGGAATEQRASELSG